VRRGWKKLYNEDLHDLRLAKYSWINYIQKSEVSAARYSNGAKDSSVHGEIAEKRTLINTSPKLENTIKVNVK
jgi:hypothetical protein